MDNRPVVAHSSMELGIDVHVLLGLTGSVASIKAPELVHLFQEEGFTVNVVATKAAHHFFDKEDITVPVYEDEDEFTCWKSRGDDVLHIKLKNWADIFVIAPMSANTLAKISNGFADNLLTCIARAWYFGNNKRCGNRKKIGIFAPAMNTDMWNNPLTVQQKTLLQGTLNWHVIPPISKMLMCGEFGEGAMEEPKKIVEMVRQLWDSK
ncbi:unnamed protein product [Schistocephalus solidus]|uniref:Flavoprotein domain-containing protein n=1 Tax=Schistocephalus solidus TaxID=70667 RepID=A0A3P7DCH3_SCHSO|nr:unnamed protein product [Schistocephalus solidus]